MTTSTRSHKAWTDKGGHVKQTLGLANETGTSPPGKPDPAILNGGGARRMGASQ